MIRVMIVEDDPMVAEFNKRYLAQAGGFELAAICSSVAEAMEELERTEAELILLDIFMPGKSGLDLLGYIRETKKEIDVIVISAASDIGRVQKALRLGAVDYLIKPFEFDRFNEALTAYQEKASFIRNQQVLSQKDLDEQLLRKEERHLPEDLPKGLTKDTLELLWKAIQELEAGHFSIDDLVSEVGISRVSVRKYLKFLIDIGVLNAKVSYGTVGRPVYQHEVNHTKIHIMNQYV
ncbi:response regulator [Bacillus mangrovi]|uniref:Response regulator n=1 Tax=Metabacillus mangrovi TaxID=1491830 RepID=A0A7X2S7W3_9BACI|nr:response regulator [Metabacillus mangrovi]MTH55308.1 response regulator [Metabacillus mangrovi]